MKKLFLLPVMMFALVGCNKGGDQPAALTVFAKYDFSTVSKKGTAIALDGATALFAGYKTEGEGAITVTEATKVYEGNGSGGVLANTAGLLKFGTGSVNGVLKFTVTEELKKVVLNCHSFYASSEDYPTNTTNFIAVNKGTPVALPYNATGAGENLEFEVTGKEVTIETSNPAPSGNTTAGRGYVFTITLYK